MPPEVRRSVAAYTLAQRSYLQNDPALARTYLDKIVKKGRWRSGITNYRLALMHDWTAAHGYPVTEGTFRPNQRVEIGKSRTIGQVLGIAITLGIAVCFFLLFLVFDAYRKSRRAENQYDM